MVPVPVLSAIKFQYFGGFVLRLIKTFIITHMYSDKKGDVLAEKILVSRILTLFKLAG